MTGSRRRVTSPARIPIELDAYASVFLRFARGREPQRHASGRAALPQVQSRQLPVSKVTHAGGEHVQADLAESRASASKRWWTLAGTVKRSGVDTFLFASFAAAAPWDISGAAFIRLDVRTPSRQDGAPQLLMILTDSRGVQYWSETGRPLATPGSGEILVPLSSFAHAPFSSGPAGALDWRSIASISVGWGGHIGTEGDRIVFEVTDPSAGLLAPRTDAAKRAKGG